MHRVNCAVFRANHPVHREKDAADGVEDAERLFGGASVLASCFSFLSSARRESRPTELTYALGGVVVFLARGPRANRPLTALMNVSYAPLRLLALAKA